MKSNKFIILIGCLLFLTSCLDINCEELKVVTQKEECNIIVMKKPRNSVYFKLEGREPITNKPSVCKSENRWWSLYLEEIEVGDTVVKRKGELTFNIHKKDTIITHYWECEGKIYK